MAESAKAGSDDSSQETSVAVDASDCVGGRVCVVRVVCRDRRVAKASKLVLEDFFQSCSQPPSVEVTPMRPALARATSEIVRKPLFPAEVPPPIQAGSKTSTLTDKRPAALKKDVNANVDKANSGESGDNLIKYDRDQLFQVALDQQAREDSSDTKDKETELAAALESFPDIRRHATSQHALPLDWEYHFGDNSYVLGIDAYAEGPAHPSFPSGRGQHVNVKRRSLLEVLRPDAPIHVWSSKLGQWVPEGGGGDNAGRA